MLAMFKRLTLRYAIDRDRQRADERIDQIKWERYEASKASLWRELELTYLSKVNALQCQLLASEELADKENTK